MSDREKQVGGSHYSDLDVQPFDVFRALGIMEAVCQANIIKYAMRYKNKNGIEDVRKIAHYTEELIKELEVHIPTDATCCEGAETFNPNVIQYCRYQGCTSQALMCTTLCVQHHHETPVSKVRCKAPNCKEKIDEGVMYCSDCLEDAHS